MLISVSLDGVFLGVENALSLIEGALTGTVAGGEILYPQPPGNTVLVSVYESNETEIKNKILNETNAVAASPFASFENGKVLSVSFDNVDDKNSFLSSDDLPDNIKVADYSDFELPETQIDPELIDEPTDGDGNLLVPYDAAYPETFKSGQCDYCTDHFLIKTNADGCAELLDRLPLCEVASLEKIIDFKDSVWYRANLEDNADVTSAVLKCRSLESVLCADYDYIYHSESTEADSSYSVSAAEIDTNPMTKRQWYLDSCDIKAAWNFLSDNGIPAGGTNNIVVAVIDTGVDYTHPDLALNMWNNRYEIPGNGVDDDNNGYIDDYYGANVISSSGDPKDDHGHGTHVAGIIGASNNNTGIVGIAYNTRIMAVKAGQSTGHFNQSDIAKAVIYAYENGADIINMSFGGSGVSLALQEALNAAFTRCILIAAAGNNSRPNEETENFKQYPDEWAPEYPAAYPYVLGVMSVDQSGTESVFTNWDAKARNHLEYELYAPGESVLSTFPGNRYVFMSGTSMAAPIVSGIAALLRSYYSDREVYTSRYIMAQLASTSDDQAKCGGKHEADHNIPMIVNAYSALTKSPRPNVSLYDNYIEDHTDKPVSAGETVHIGLTLRNTWGVSKDTVIRLDTRTRLGNDAFTGAPLYGDENPYVTIADGYTDLASVGTYNTKTMLTYDSAQLVNGITDPFVLTVSPDCPNNYYVTVYAVITYKNGLDETDQTQYVSEGSFTFTVQNGIVKTGIITEDETWTKDKLYVITGSLVVEEGASVTVQAGTSIQFYPSSPMPSDIKNVIPAQITAKGSFITDGNESEPVKIFPSDEYYNFSVSFKRPSRGDKLGNGYELYGTIDFNYTEITNPNMVLSSANHCIFKGNSDNVYSFSSNGFTPNNNSLFASEISYSVIDSVPEIFPFASFKHCIFRNNQTRHPRTGMSYDSCVFMGNFASEMDRYTSYNTISFDQQTINVFNMVSRESWDVFRNNAIINDFHINDVTKWYRIKSWTGSGQYSIANNWWGTTDPTIIEKQIVDFYFSSSYVDFDPYPALQSPPEDVWPFVTDAYLLNSAGNRVQAVGNEAVRFVVEFNRDMDVTEELSVRFGAEAPYANYTVTGAFVTPRRWEGVYTLKTLIENGTQYFRIENGRAADDHFMELNEMPARFSFVIDTSLAMTLSLRAEAQDTGISLEWEQDEYDTLAGYNIYRSDKEDGLFVKLNSVVIPVGEEHFFDDDIEPGKLYYYNFTIVLSDMTETGPSGKISIVSKDTLAPDIYHTAVRSAYLNTNLVLNAIVTDNLSVQNVTLYYRSPLETVWHSVEMTKFNNKYTAMIPGDFITSDGFVYYIEASDGINLTSRASAAGPISVRVNAPLSSGSKGDVDGDGIITGKDALMIVQAVNDLINLTEAQFIRADLNDDGELSSAEALTILKYVSGKISSITG